MDFRFKEEINRIKDPVFMASGKKQFILVLLGVLLLSSCVDLVRRPKVQNGPKDPALFGEWYDDGELKSLLADPERFESFVKTHTRISIGTCYHPNGVMEDISVVYEDGELYPKLVRYKDGVYYAKDGFIYMLVPSAKWSSDNAIKESYEVRGDTLRIGFYEEHPEGHLCSRRNIVPSECPKNPFVK